MEPFRQLPFESLPERPRVPHGFFELPEERLRVRSEGFGAIELSVRRAGSGPPLVLVHGLMTSSYSFRYVIEPLARDYTVIVFDLPGAGRSDAPRAPYTPDALADLIGDTLRALGVEGARVIGNSMGGYLAMRLALRRPGAMSRLVNLHSPGAPTPRMWALEAALSLPGSAAIVDRLVRRDPLRWAFRNVHYWDESLKSLEEAREYGAPLATPAGREAFARYLGDTLRASEMRRFARQLAALERFPVPLQLVYARRDPMVPPEVGAALARLVPGAELVWLDEGSHFAHVDAPDVFLAAARPFLAAA
ncbi:MAG: alpha/beta hydrolase [Sandaracinaceae bacterium]|nr:alpha/beta hydrolase [Sandaracinaceae bacterium]